MSDMENRVDVSSLSQSEIRRMIMFASRKLDKSQRQYSLRLRLRVKARFSQPLQTSLNLDSSTIKSSLKKYVYQHGLSQCDKFVEPWMSIIEAIEKKTSPVLTRFRELIGEGYSFRTDPSLVALFLNQGYLSPCSDVDEIRDSMSLMSDSTLSVDSVDSIIQNNDIIHNGAFVPLQPPALEPSLMDLSPNVPDSDYNSEFPVLPLAPEASPSIWPKFNAQVYDHGIIHSVAPSPTGYPTPDPEDKPGYSESTAPPPPPPPTPSTGLILEEPEYFTDHDGDGHDQPDIESEKHPWPPQRRYLICCPSDRPWMEHYPRPVVSTTLPLVRPSVWSILPLTPVVQVNDEKDG